MAEEEKTVKKLKAEELGVSEDRDRVLIGMDERARQRLYWDAAGDGNLLIAGYGVRHTSWLVQALIAHYKEYKVPVYGIDGSTLLPDFKKGTFARLVNNQNDGLELLETLGENDGEQTLIITNAAGFINPTYSTLSADAVAGIRQDIVDNLVKLIDDDHTHVIFQTSKFNSEADLPRELLSRLASRILTGRQLARDMIYLETTEADIKKSDKASIWDNLMIQDGNSFVFQNSRPGMLRAMY